MNSLRMTWSFILLVVLCCLFASSIYAQSDTDSTDVSPEAGKSPRKAMILSAILPGMGQWYNDQKIKAVLVCGTELGLIGSSVYWNQKVVASISDDERLIYEDKRSLMIWWYFGIYLLNILDAYVDAQLWHFDVGPDLTWKDNDRRLCIAMRYQF